MVLTVNGESREVAAARLPALLEELGHEGGFFAVALNGQVVRRAAWPETELAEGDEIEIVTPRQGG